ncbi:hypothetical protein WQ54_15690 [Bacillus sp. SA1-12]|uniref:hypothetical protein n=1 Tax=Bacillus sp. SA1-12 TaxID=1455638 RepID=UPI00062730D4|nr:hypothetical protein [Bacillus sp. SA1-12]KKI91265.1 hypothetical protein WQ54_15690 [Bacillus sp. SA1-12]
MNKYKISYFLDNGFSVSQIVESDSRENVYKRLAEECIINFTDENDVYFILNMNEVKLISVIEVESKVQSLYSVLN